MIPKVPLICPVPLPEAASGKGYTKHNITTYNDSRSS